MTRHIHHCWSRLGHKSFFFLLILNPLRHCGAANQTEIFGAAKRAEMADIEQMKKIVPLITCEIPFGQDDCELVFGVNVTDLKFSVQINPVKQPTNPEQLCGSVKLVSVWDFDL